MDRLSRGLSATLMQFILLTGVALNGFIVQIPNDGACFFTCLAYYVLYCEKNSLQKPPVLSNDRDDVRRRLCDFLHVNQMNVMISDPVNQLTVHQYFLDTYGLHAVERKAVVISSDRIFVNTFEKYLECMRNPEAHADELFVWAASQMFNMRLSVLEKVVQRITDPKLQTLVEMGYSEAAAINALQQASGDIEGAVTYLLQNQSSSESSESSDIWREDVHNPSGKFECRIIRTGRHFQLVFPQYVQREVEPKLPPRTRKEIVSAQAMWNDHSKGAAAVSGESSSQKRNHCVGGGAAAVPHQPLPSFGYTQEVSGWIEQLKEFFPSLAIDSLLQHMVMPSGTYKTTFEDLESHAILLSSIRYDALRMFEKVVSAFLYSAPNLTVQDFKEHSIVASFSIGQQMFRCTAVVFKDEHVVAFPGLKHLKKGNPRRDQLRKEFYAAIDAHFQKNPRVVIKMMLIEPCD